MGGESTGIKNLSCFEGEEKERREDYTLEKYI
jgi:hypothetical protein